MSINTLPGSIEEIKQSGVIEVQIPQNFTKPEIENLIRASLICNLNPEEIELAVAYYMSFIDMKMVEDGPCDFSIYLAELRNYLSSIEG